MKPPSPLSLVIAAMPFVAICFSVPVWDRIYPIVLGLPFNLFWLIGWTVLSSVCLAVVYRIEKRRDHSGGGLR
jgi:hypothetical protein